MKSVTRGHMKAGLDSLRGAKWRNVWTMLGVIIGVASVLIIVGIGEGVKQQIGGQIAHVSKNLITVTPGSFSSSTGFTSGSLNIVGSPEISGSLNSQEISAVANTVGVNNTAQLTAIPAAVSGAYGAYHSGTVIGTSPSLATLLNQSLAYGVFMSPADMGTNVAVLGQNAARKLFKEDVPLGNSFTLDGQSFTVRGVFNGFDSAPLTGQTDFDNDIFIPYDTAGSLASKTAVTYEMLALANQNQKVTNVINRMRQNVATADGGQTAVRIQKQSQTLSHSSSVLELLTRLVSGVAAISLIVGGIGIMNVMLVSVTERMHEIGIRKAIGATNRQILSQFMIEATVLSVIGGIIGIIIAFAVEVSLRVATTFLRPAISWQITVIAFVVSIAIGIIFGSIPAWRAARKDPIEALRTD